MRKLRNLIAGLILVFCAISGWAQPYGEYKYLLNHPGVRLESTDAVNAMYNFNFTESEKGFNWLKFKFPKHPLPFFLLGLSEWWKIMPNDAVTTYDKQFFAWMDSTIYAAENLYKKDKENQEAIFFLAAAYGFKGRRHADIKNWTSAAWNGKQAMTYMDKSKRSEDFGIEFLFGHALYDYYREWVPENYKMLKFVMAPFPRGDKQRGIKQLEEVVNNAFYTRVEANYFLIRIYNNEENKPQLAWDKIKALTNTYPNNPYFQRTYARTAYYLGYADEAIKACENIVYNHLAGATGYEEQTYRYATFILGDIYFRRFDKYEEAKKYLKDCIAASEKIDSKGGYYLYSLAYLARIADKEKNKEEAIRLYEKLEDDAERGSDLKKEAKEFLKKNKKKRFLFF